MSLRRSVRAILFSLLSVAATAQERIMTYNFLNYSGTDTTRNAAFRTVLASANPDILVAQEMTTQAGVNMVVSSILNAVAPGQFTAGPFMDGPDTDNAIFVRSSKFIVLANRPIRTALRDISEFTLRHTLTGDTLRIYSVHLKASSGSSNEAARAAEVDSLRKVTDALPAGSAFIVVGDFNLYGSTEAAYQKLLEVHPGKDGQFYDALNMTGIWNAAQYAPYHTQSPRVRQFGGGATGGLDDRFDLLLYSRSMRDSGKVRFVAGSLTAFGNDGNHYNDSINRLPNTAVSAVVAQALHDASDHLPVFAAFVFSESPLPVELSSVSVSATTAGALLRWRTSTEIDNAGFDVERKTIRGNVSSASVGEWKFLAFISGAGISNIPVEYSYLDALASSGRYVYRLKQMDRSGGFRYSQSVEVELSDVPSSSVLLQNFPNPFNPSTTIRYQVSGVRGQGSAVSLKVYDLLGHEVAVLVNDQKEPGIYGVTWEAMGLPSGVYLCRLIVDKAQSTHKLVLMR